MHIISSCACTTCLCAIQGAAKRLRAAEEKLDQVLEAALGDDFDAFDDFDAMEEAVPPPRPAGGHRVCSFRQACVAQDSLSNAAQIVLQTVHWS